MDVMCFADNISFTIWGDINAKSKYLNIFLTDVFFILLIFG